MEAIELYKFIEETESEYHWGGYAPNREVYLLIDCEYIARFNALFPSHSVDDGGIECVMKEGYFGFEMVAICENNDIDPKEVFTKEDSI